MVDAHTCKKAVRWGCSKKVEAFCLPSWLGKKYIVCFKAWKGKYPFKQIMMKSERGVYPSVEN